ncbi:L,D-transpeptidase family protein [Azoarcus olearius]|uniref:Periplasmic protein n=1 Tax=Azoarcus sp. (strain BH72) TaxID=418699 RepID=A1K9W1_AZOSB|nr:L,D-transpeptidase family protein [Azoarcus olearius]CAL95616.1 putative periplasmic protein [Azoarcus olearius]
MKAPALSVRAPRALRRVFAAWLCGVALLASAPAQTVAAPEEGVAPSWFAHGRPVPAARQAVDILAAAAAEGLDPADYDAGALRAQLDALGRGTAPETQAAFDAALSAAMARYLGDVHRGRIDPRSVHAAYAGPAPEAFDADAYLRAALAEDRVEEAARAAVPPLPLYGALRTALAHYRTLAAGADAQAAWSLPLPLPPRRKLEPGQPYAGLALLARRLTLLGDLVADVPLPPRYEGALVDAVKRFQLRHGLAADGVVGRGTLAELEVAPAARVRQIELTMERLRWTPLLQAPRMIVVNVPEFMLRAYEVRDGRIEVAARMKVIVGKALDTRTPLFAEDMRFIEFSPYWNVPPSIARAELVPRLRREPGYWNAQGFEFVAGDGTANPTLSTAGLDAVLRGTLRIRQRPGPHNALGDIKFVFPNNDNIYLHHTPTPQLFARDRRDFSHGCIRVEAPVELARFVLRDQPEWDEARIREAMSAGSSKTIRVATPLPVLIAYGTAMVDAEGHAHFFRDIYGHDQLLHDTLLRRSRGNSPVAVEGGRAQ